MSSVRWPRWLLCLVVGQMSLVYAADHPGYLPLAQPQARTQSAVGAKVEVIEFFSYTCPICFSYEPALTGWVARAGDRIAFRRVPIGLRATWVPAQKMYFALELLGKADVMHKKIFNAIHVDKMSVQSDEAVIDLVASLGLNRKQFSETYHSAAVQAKVAQALQMQKAYQIDQVPLVAVDGRYLTSPAVAGEQVGADKPLPELQAASLKILDDLIAKPRTN